MATMHALSSKQGAFMGTAKFAPVRPQQVKRATLQVTAGLKAVRDQIASVKNTQKITEAMKLVAAAKVRRAQAAVINGRPFAENLIKVLYGVNQRLRTEDVDSPLCQVRPVKSVMIVVLSGDRGLCGGYNNFIIKKTIARFNELAKMGISAKLVFVGKKAYQFFKRRPQYPIAAFYDMGSSPTTRQAQAIADKIFASFLSEESDKVEMVFTKFVSLLTSTPTIQTLLPLSPKGELCDIDGKCVDPTDDEMFFLTTNSGQLSIGREKAPIETEAMDSSLIFEQEPAQILDALLPLYLNACLLRSLQEATASELASRMNAMSNASDNARDMKKLLNTKYNRARQAKITQEISEIVAGAYA
jgi:F-type H+-transporting ATPase subunit gamma